MSRSILRAAIVSTLLWQPLLGQSSAPADAILGEWVGTSTCTKAAWNASCNDEETKYVFTQTDTKDAVQEHAYKKINGAYELMGEQVMTFDATAHEWFADFSNERVRIRRSYQVVDSQLTGKVVDLRTGQIARQVLAHRVKAPGQARYLRAAVNAQGRLRIDVENAAPVIVPLDRPVEHQSRHVGFTDIAIAPNGRAVGWIAQYSSCGPIGPVADGYYCDGVPGRLVVYEARRIHSYGDGIPIWNWAFLAGGSQVGYMRMMMHFSNEEYYELRDVETDRLLDKVTVDITAPPATLPEWVRKVDQK